MKNNRAPIVIISLIAVVLLFLAAAYILGFGYHILSVFFVFLALFVLCIPVYVIARFLSSFKKEPQAAPSIKVKTMDTVNAVVLICLFIVGCYLNAYGARAGEQLHVYEIGGRADGYASLAPNHIFSAIVLVVLGMAGFLILNFYAGRVSPVIYVVSSTILVLNIGFAAVYFTHTLFSKLGDMYSVRAFQYSLFCLALLYITKLKDSLNEFSIKMRKETVQYKGFLLLLFKISVRYSKMPRLWAICFFPVLLIVQMVLILFGQRPDSFIRLFLDTSSFTYSRIPNPPQEMLKGDEHYLCSVAARGHTKVVKPVRAGLRHGKRIPVNRQLLVANAFEHLLEEYMPRMHHFIRYIYDKYGYPLSRHIRTKWSADLVYFFMKPLEWFFLFILYTVDQKPENRIQIQYSELRK